MENFGSILRRLREQRGFTLNQFAIYAGVSNGLISKIENGKRGTPKPETIEKLAKALKMEYSELMVLAGYSDEKEKSSSDAAIDSANELIHYLEVLELSNEEIVEKMDFRVDNLRLTPEEAMEFVDFVRVKRLMKKQNGIPLP
ncbi:helix-turn-helix domain-containing protein [Paenibacillus silvisoli]|uniref:helix-turn-helix domain-containing protein n=1 Tax=Paenibacillus silvisoli TaxID=3110539 RepID=UPI0038994190